MSVNGVNITMWKEKALNGWLGLPPSFLWARQDSDIIPARGPATKRIRVLFQVGYYVHYIESGCEPIGLCSIPTSLHARTN